MRTIKPRQGSAAAMQQQEPVTETIVKVQEPPRPLPPGLRPKRPPALAQPTLDDPLANFIGDVNKTRSKSSPGTRRKDYIAEVESRIARQDWNNVNVGLLVAIYWVCHVKIYGTPPAELDSASAWTNAMKCAGLLVQQQFDGDVQKAVNFLRWVWTREREREEWRKKNDVPTKRISWQQQFIYKTLVTDWRAAKFRAGA